MKASIIWLAAGSLAWTARSSASHSAGQALLRQTSEPRELKGRFLHITDIHPDPFYKTRSLTDEDHACHRGKGTAGYYGAELSNCDSPFSLVNATLKWIEEHLQDEVDFVIWTGDSARHNNDDKIPRNLDQVLGQNRELSEAMSRIFGPGPDVEGKTSNRPAVTVVPNLGNNDVSPHNIFYPGPNQFTVNYLKIWDDFIPPAQRSTFERGGWFFSEVIADHLAIFSLNSLYFFDSNDAAKGCDKLSQPGYDQFEWLRVQLNDMRDRGMKVMIIGHVPPAMTWSKINWDDTCWHKYLLFTKQYRDIVIGSFWGHMNIDHFILQDAEDIVLEKLGSGELDDQRLKVGDVPTYFEDLRYEWSQIPKPPSHHHSSERKYDKKLEKYYEKIGGEYGERYALSFVSPSVIPNYFPSLRVFAYNTSSLPDAVVGAGPSIPAAVDFTPASAPEAQKHKHPEFRIPDGPSKHSPPGPAYSPQPLSLVGYTQLFANLTTINNDFRKGHREALSDGDDVAAKKWRNGKHHGKKPSHPPDPLKFEFEVLYNTHNDSLYKMPDLTVGSYLNIARKIGKGAAKKDRTPEGEEDGAEIRNGAVGGEAEEQEAGEGASIEKKKHKRKHKHKHRHGKKSHNKAWFLFLKRAFVGAVEDEEIEKHYWVAPPEEQ